MLKNEGGERRLKLGLTRVRVAFLGKIFDENLRGMEAEAEGRPEGPLEFAANFGRKFYPKKGSVTLANHRSSRTPPPFWKRTPSRWTWLGKTQGRTQSTPNSNTAELIQDRTQ